MKVERHNGEFVIRLPSEFVEALQLFAGDEIALRVAGPNCVEIVRVASEDLISSFEEWSSPEDEKAFRDL